MSRVKVTEYATAVVTSALALGLALLLGGSSNVSSLLFLGAVAVTAWYGGFRPALVAILLGFIALDYFFEIPAYSFEVSDIRTLLDSVAYLLIAVLLGSLNAQLRNARARADAARLEAEEAMGARDDALAAVSHDMRTPVTAIQASVAALQNSDSELTDEVRANLLANVAAESERLAHFISDALALGRIEAGIQAAPTLSAAGELISAILDRHALQLAGRQINFDVPDTLPLMPLDAGLLEQAVGNVLDNVAVHTPAGTAVTITGRIDRQGCLRLEIGDAGPGIPPDARERVFARFERLGGRGPGAGLGLTLARAAAQAQGGSMWIEDGSLGGACFVLHLPASQAVKGEAATRN
jgi:two-component system sensor histidine kinase KdpD